jgi:hypothetical protein
MKAKVGDIVRHPADGDIGVVLSICNELEGDAFYAIHWMKDGHRGHVRYKDLQLLTDTNCPGRKDSA